MARATDWLASRARLTPSKEAVVEVATGLRLTYAELNRRANRLASHLQQAGVGQGDRIALLAPNSVHYLELLFATGKIGAIFVPLNYRFSIIELVDVLLDCQPRVLVYHESFEEKAQQVREQVEVPFVFDEAVYQSVIAHAPEHYTSPVIDEEDPWAIIYTGGTTGKSKGVMISHRAILWNSINSIISWGLTEHEITPVYIPMFHTGGLNALATPILHVGGTVVIGTDFNPSTILQMLEQERCTIALFIPTMYHMMISTPEFAQMEFTHMHTFLSGGAPCPHSIYEAFWAKKLQFKEGYGLTEAGPNNFYIHPQDSKHKVGSVGVPMFHNSIRVVDDHGQDVPDGETGEVWIQGPHVFSGYWNRPAITAQTLVDGWLRTGDLAMRDADGYHYIVGRKKDMIISGGENVYPLEVEQVLDAHQAVSEVVVVGVPDVKWGEAVTAVIVPVPDRELTVEELKAYCAQKLANYKIPKEFYFVTDIPKTPVGKIDKKSVVELFSPTA